MPELPEVETTCRGLAPLLTGHTLTGATVREPRLRWPVDAALNSKVQGRTVLRVYRQAKYVVLVLSGECYVLIHLGMSGSVRVLPATPPAARHDHLDLCFADQVLRLHDPRRFGAVLWGEGDPCQHPRLLGLGCEPLTAAFSGEGLFAALRRKAAPIKTVLMDNKVVVGVGNIYANESLFLAGIQPTRPAHTLSLADCYRMVSAVKTILTRAIEAGGSTLRDFTNAVGKPGYFQQSYTVYGRAGAPCAVCGSVIIGVRLGQRMSSYCPVCQQ